MIRRINKLKNVGRFAELRSQGGNQHEFTTVNVIYAPNACGKTTLCDVFRSLGTGKLDFILGRKRFGSATAIEIEILLHGSPTPRAVFAPVGWKLEPAGSIAHRTLVYDDRFVADNVLVGHSIAVEQRRNLYGLALGAQGRLLREAVDTAEQELAAATTALNTSRTALTPLVPVGFTNDTFRPLLKDDAIDQLLEEATEELEAARRTKQNANSIRQRKSISVSAPPLTPDGVAAALEATLDDAGLQAEAKIRQHLATHSRGLSPDWVGQGHRAQIGTACPPLRRGNGGIGNSSRLPCILLWRVAGPASCSSPHRERRRGKVRPSGTAANGAVAKHSPCRAGLVEGCGWILIRVARLWEYPRGSVCDGSRLLCPNQVGTTQARTACPARGVE